MISADRGVGYTDSDSTTIATKTAATQLPRFLTAYGAYETHAVTLESGKPNCRPEAGRPYQSISWDDIRVLVASPAAEHKDEAQFFIPSTYVEHDGRKHDAQRERGEYWGLATDIDKGSPSLEAVEAAVRAVAPGAAAMIYSSSSASPAAMKWRVLIPLAAPISGADYPDTLEALFGLLAARGIECDIALARTGQPIYLPNVPPKKRGRDGRPVFYRSLIIEGEPLDLSQAGAIIRGREALRARRATEEAEAAARAEAAREARRAYIEATGDDFDPVEHFNATTPLAGILADCGFTKHPRKEGDYRSPLSESKTYSTRVYAVDEDSPEYWVAVSAWAQTHNVGRKTAKGFRTGDSFDLFVFFKHKGDRRAAVLAHVQAARPDLFAGLETDPARREDFLAAWASTSRRRWAAAEQLPDRGPTRSIEEMRQAIAERMNKAMRWPGPIHLFRPPTGTGKTTLALDAAVLSRVEAAYLADRPEATEAKYPTSFAMSLPTHTNVREVDRTANQKGLHSAAYPERTADNCGRIEKASKAAGMGLNVFEAVCASCPVATKCRESGYLAWVKSANESDCKIGTHDRAVVAGKMTEKADAILIDEDPAKALAPTYAADAEDIFDVLRWAEGIRDSLDLDGRDIDAATEDKIFAAALVDAAERIILARDGAKVVSLELPAEQRAAAEAEKEKLLGIREKDHQRAAGRLSEAKAAAKLWRRRVKEVCPPRPEKDEDEDEEQEELPPRDAALAAEVKAMEAQATATLKQRSKQARAAAAALERTKNKPLTAFAAGRPPTTLAPYPPGRVITLDLPAEVRAPENWSELVFQWAERYGDGKAINPEARKIVMLAATGGLEALFLVRPGEDPDGKVRHYAFAKGRTAIPRDRVVLALDATADAEALRAMTGREVIDHTPEGHVPLAHEAIQFTTDLTADTSPAEVAKIVEAILERFPKKRRVGLIGWRKAIAGLDEELGEAARGRIAKVAYFWEGPDRGSNDWIKPVEDGGAGCDLLIVLGTPRPGTEPVRKMLIAMGMVAAASLPDGDWGPRRWQGAGTDGRIVTVDAGGYRHPDWHRAYCLIVRSMLLQAIGRARASLPEGIPVVALTVEPTGLPAADPLPVLGAEVRQTADLARGLAEAAKRNSISISPKDQIALRGWVRTADLVLALTEPGAVRKRTRKATAGLSKRAALIRVERAVAADRLVRGPRGWVGIAGECEPWPSTPPKPTAARLAAPAVSTPPVDVRPATRPSVAASEPVHASTTPPADQLVPVSPFDPATEEQIWSPMTLTKTG